MAEFKLCAFADEAGDSLAEQIKAMQENGIGLLELRTIDKKRLKDKVCHLDDFIMEQVNEALKISLELH